MCVCVCVFPLLLFLSFMYKYVANDRIFFTFDWFILLIYPNPTLFLWFYAVHNNRQDFVFNYLFDELSWLQYDFYFPFTFSSSFLFSFLFICNHLGINARVRISGISKVELSLEELELVLQTLVYDCRLEEVIEIKESIVSLIHRFLSILTILMMMSLFVCLLFYLLSVQWTFIFSYNINIIFYFYVYMYFLPTNIFKVRSSVLSYTGHSGSGQTMYKVAKNINPPNFLTESPCGVCPGKESYY